MLRRWSLMWCLVLLAAIAPPLSAAAPSSQRLRPQSPRVAGWIADGMARSATFRALVERIEQGDVIVYLESQPRLRELTAETESSIRMVLTEDQWKRWEELRRERGGRRPPPR